MSQVISAFLERYGKPSPLKVATHVSIGETRRLRNVTLCSQWSTNTPNGDVCHFSRFHCAIATQIRAGTTSGTRSISSTMFDHMKDMAMTSFRPVFINEASDADTEECRSTCFTFATISDSLVTRVRTLSRRVCS